MKICHMTSAHNVEDVRIFHKECTSLSNAGFEVFLVGRGESFKKNGVQIAGVGSISSKRFKRMSEGAKKVYKEALKIDADIYHFHDPELLPYGLKLKKRGKLVIFDSHEDVSAQIMDKPWIPLLLRRAVSSLYYHFETRVVKELDAVVTATPHIADTFKNRAREIAVVNNYPKLDDIIFQTKRFRDRQRIIAYAGGLSEVRGEKVLIEAMETVDGILSIACEHAIEERGNVKYIGKQDRQGVNELYGNSMAGIVIYQPADNHYDSQPIKMFEFMAAGLPVVASNFPLWKSIVEENNCGICVDPCNSSAVSAACNTLLTSPEMAEEMGKNGRDAIERKYSWISEEKKLLDLYERLRKTVISRY